MAVASPQRRQQHAVVGTGGGSWDRMIRGVVIVVVLLHLMTGDTVSSWLSGPEAVPLGPHPPSTQHAPHPGTMPSPHTPDSQTGRAAVVAAQQPTGLAPTDAAPDVAPESPPEATTSPATTARPRRRRRGDGDGPVEAHFTGGRFLSHHQVTVAESAEGGPDLDPDGPVAEEPVYPVDLGKYERTYSPTFLPMDAVQRRFRALAWAAPWCRIGRSRRSVYTLFDSVAFSDGGEDERGSDVEPPLSPQVAAQWMHGNKLVNLRNQWPSQKFKKPSRPDGRTGPDGFAREAVDEGKGAPTVDAGTGRCTRRNAVLAVAVGYDDERLLPLTASWLRYGHPCDVLVTLRDACTSRHSRFASEDGAQSAGETRKNADVTGPRIQCQGFGSTAMSKNLAERQRVSVIAGWLRDNWKLYDYVIHVDSRDTQFFGDPFVPLYGGNFTGLFGAGEAFRYSDFPTGQSRMWVGSYSSGGGTQDGRIIDRIANLRLGGRAFPTICSGLYGGSSAAMLDFARAYDDAITGATAHVKRLHGVDQGILIHLFIVTLVFAQYPHPVRLFDEGLGPYTHFIARDQPILFSPDGRLLNCALRPYAIAHQLDRHEGLEKRHRLRLRPHKPQPGTGAGYGNVAGCAIAPPDLTVRERVLGGNEPGRKDVVGATTVCHIGGTAQPLGATLLKVAAKLGLGDPVERSAEVKYGAPLAGRDPRVTCSTVSAVIAAVAIPDMRSLGAFVGSFTRHHSTCAELHLLFFGGDGGRAAGTRGTPQPRFAGLDNVFDHDFVVAAGALSPEERVEAVAEFLQASQKSRWRSRRATWAARRPAVKMATVLMSTGGGGNTFSDAAIRSASAQQGGSRGGQSKKPSTLLDEEHILFTGNVFAPFFAASNKKNAAADEWATTVLVPREPAAPSASGASSPRRAALVKELVEGPGLPACLGPAVSVEQLTALRGQLQGNTPAAASCTSQLPEDVRRPQELGSLGGSGVVTPTVAFGGPAAVARYLALAAQAVRQQEGCTAAAMLSFVLPTMGALQDAQRDLEPALTIRAAELSTSVVAFARAGGIEAPYDAHGRFYTACPDVSAAALPLAIGVEAPHLWRELSRDYDMGEPADALPSRADVRPFTSGGVATSALLEPLARLRWGVSGREEELPIVGLFGGNGTRYFART